MSEGVYDKDGFLIGDSDGQGNFEPNPRYQGGKTNVYTVGGQPWGIVNGHHHYFAETHRSVAAQGDDYVTAARDIISDRRRPRGGGGEFIVMVMVAVGFIVIPYWGAYKIGRHGWDSMGRLPKRFFAFVLSIYVLVAVLTLVQILIEVFAPYVNTGCSLSEHENYIVNILVLFGLMYALYCFGMFRRKKTKRPAMS